MDDLVVVTAEWTHRLADTTRGSVVRAACGGEVAAVAAVVPVGEATRPRCPDCWPALDRQGDLPSP